MDLALYASAIALIGKALEYGNLAMQAEGAFEKAWPVIQENLQLGYSILTRGTPPTDAEKADLDARHDAIHTLMQQDFKDRDAEAAALGLADAPPATPPGDSGTDLSGQ